MLLLKVIKTGIQSTGLTALLVWLVGASSYLLPYYASAADYVVDTKGAHAFVQFRIKHLGYSWLYGRFNDFSGEFTYDQGAPEKNKISMKLDVTSIDSNHAERDKHLRGEKYLNTEKYPDASFESTEWKDIGDGKAELVGNLTLHGTTKPITISVEKIGEGKDPWGGYRVGFEGRAKLQPADFGMELTKLLGPSADEVELFLSVEGIKK